MRRKEWKGKGKNGNTCYMLYFKTVRIVMNNNNDNNNDMKIQILYR
jgi:hypothetical protein